MVTKKRRTSLPNQHTSAQGNVNAACLSLLRSTFSISLFRPAKADFGRPPFEALRQKNGFYQCSAPCRRRRPNHGHRFTLQGDGSGGFLTGLGRLEACAGKWILNLEASFEYLPVL